MRRGHVVANARARSAYRFRDFYERFLFFDEPRRREAAFCHGVLSHCYAASALSLGMVGDDAMHLFTHSFDYIALGILIACMLLAAAKAIPRP